MKKKISLLLSISLSLSLLFVQPAAAMTMQTPYPSGTAQLISTENTPSLVSVYDNMPEISKEGLMALPSEPGFSYDFQPPGSNWDNLVKGILPASFSQVSYQLADNVLDVTGSTDVVESIATQDQILSGGTTQLLRPNDIIAAGGLIPMSVLDSLAAAQGRTIENGTVVVDKRTNTAFKVLSPTAYSGAYESDPELQQLVEPLKDTYALATPQLHEIFKDFSLGSENGETIELTRGNISGFAKNIERNLVMSPLISTNPQSFTDDMSGFNDVFGDLLVRLEFSEEVLEGKLNDGSTIQIKVSGGIGIQRIQVDARYTRFSGYRFALTLRQESYLRVELDAKLNEEVRIPIFGIDAGIGDIGRVTGGVFVIVSMDGTLRLEISAREFTSTTVGVRGGTALYVPTSIRPIHSQTIKGDGDVKLTGKIDGSIRFGPMIGVELFGFDLIGAGVFLGTGVRVEADDFYLDVELYGILNVYVEFLGKHFNLVNLRPTLWQKRQLDTAGYQISFMEAYVYPGRVSGTIKREVPPSGSGPGDGYAPVPNIPYRIWVVPKGYDFDPQNPSSLNNPAIRKYPSNGYAQTNADGVFFQKNDNILSGGDKAYLEFQTGGKTYFSNPAEATLPFENYTITEVDYFNDYVVGQVQPIRLTNWDATTPEDRYEWIYYKNSPVTVRVMLYVTTISSTCNTGGVAYARTDEYGNFDTRDIYKDDNGNVVSNWLFDILGDGDWMFFDEWRVRVALDYDGATIAGEVPFSPTMTMLFSRALQEVPGSYKRYEENGKIIDQMAYDEYIWIVNPNGTNTVSEDEFCYHLESFSTQDLFDGKTDYRYASEEEKNALWELGAPKGLTPAYKLIPINDSYGLPTGSALFSQRVTVEWVWQAHPNPMKIITKPVFQTTTGGGEFDVAAIGYAPYAFSLDGAPEGVSIDRDTGIIKVAAGQAAGTYEFVVRAEENREAYQIVFPNGVSLDRSKIDGPYDGNDPSPPALQNFTLTVVQSAVEPKPSPAPTDSPAPDPTKTPAPEPTPAPTPTATPAPTPQPTPVLTPPDINAAEHGYNFFMGPDGMSVEVVVTASGSTPITWSLLNSGDLPFPSTALIHPDTGALFIGPDIPYGTYYFTIRAKNEAGSDYQNCTVTIGELQTPPVIREADHGYAFIRLITAGETLTPIYADGSTPMVWSLVQTGRYPLPDGVSIDAATGVLKFEAGIDAGSYYFTIRVQNGAGTDTQECTLNVVRFINPFGSTEEEGQSADFDNQGLAYQTLSSLSGMTNFEFFKEEPYAGFENFFEEDLFPDIFTDIAEIAPPNAITIRYDDPNDVYTNDRWIKNGATFVRWHSAAGVLQRFAASGEIWTGGTGTLFLDESPRCDNYHYHGKEGDTLPVDEIMQYFSEKSIEDRLESLRFEDRLNPVNRVGLVDNITGQGVKNSSYDEYGQTINDMGAKNGGSFQVTLDKNTSTSVTGKYFVALQGNPTATLSFIQEGATITFKGSDVLEATPHGLLALTYYKGAFQEADMKTASSGAEGFSYGFAGHGALPGMATFEIATDLSPGTTVHVYLFDGETGQFSLIAGNIPVGKDGVVTYRNNTLSEYIITTQPLPGALISEVSDRQEIPKAKPYWLIGAGIGILLIGSAGVLWMLLRKRKAGKA
ncbi:MAG: hypothetical protein JXB33_02800 [Clostridia bacterium]|nr:hypothetical protein [Clostridia bacterium]